MRQRCQFNCCNRGRHVVKERLASVADRSGIWWGLPTGDYTIACQASVPTMDCPALGYSLTGATSAIAANGDAVTANRTQCGQHGCLAQYQHTHTSTCPSPSALQCQHGVFDAVAGVTLVQTVRGNHKRSTATAGTVANASNRDKVKHGDGVVLQS